MRDFSHPNAPEVGVKKHDNSAAVKTINPVEEDLSRIPHPSTPEEIQESMRRREEKAAKKKATRLIRSERKKREEAELLKMDTTTYTLFYADRKVFCSAVKKAGNLEDQITLFKGYQQKAKEHLESGKGNRSKVQKDLVSFEKKIAELQRLLDEKRDLIETLKNRWNGILS